MYMCVFNGRITSKPHCCATVYDFILRKRSLDTRGDRKPLIIFGKLLLFISFFYKMLPHCRILKNIKRAVKTIPLISQCTADSLKDCLTLKISDKFVTLSTQNVDRQISHVQKRVFPHIRVV